MQLQLHLAYIIVCMQAASFRILISDLYKSIADSQRVGPERVPHLHPLLTLHGLELGVGCQGVLGSQLHWVP